MVWRKDEFDLAADEIVSRVIKRWGGAELFIDEDHGPGEFLRDVIALAIRRAHYQHRPIVLPGSLEVEDE